MLSSGRYPNRRLYRYGWDHHQRVRRINPGDPRLYDLGRLYQDRQEPDGHHVRLADRRRHPRVFRGHPGHEGFGRTTVGRRLALRHGDVRVKTRLYLDGEDLRVEHWQDVEPILEENQILRSTPQKSEWCGHYARVPTLVLLRWLNEEAARGNLMAYGSPEYYEMVYQKLQDPE